jgi:hypothetical protein
MFGALEIGIGRCLAHLIALVAEIEAQVFSGVSFLIGVAEGAVERVVQFRFLPSRRCRIFLFLWWSGGWRLRSERWSWFGLRFLDTSLRPCRWFRLRFLNPSRWFGRNSRTRITAMLALDDVAFDRGLEPARTGPRGTERARLLRFILGRWRSRFAHFRGHRVGIEHVAASRALEGRCIVRQDALVDPITGVATGALNFDHSPTSHPAQKIIIRRRVAHLLTATSRSPAQCG